MFGSATNASGARAARTSPGSRARPAKRGAADAGPPRAAGFVPYAGDGYAMLLPGKWNPSKEREFAGMDVRCEVPAGLARRVGRTLTRAARACSYEDNFDAVNTLFVLVKPAEKSKMEARAAQQRSAVTRARAGRLR